ncbi:unnamed protein product, partial [Protopolystoma xenopodis]
MWAISPRAQLSNLVSPDAVCEAEKRHDASPYDVNSILPPRVFLSASLKSSRLFLASIRLSPFGPVVAETTCHVRQKQKQACIHATSMPRSSTIEHIDSSFSQLHTSPSISPSLHLPTRPMIHLSIHQFLYLSIYPSIHPSIHPS